ncbi:MAG: hypothetical protein VYA71_06145 [Pseudomonadota bacterium]|nr:hypothetical protein [Pseudomonadota bacterium]
MTRIAFLHTADVHIRTFDDLLADLAPNVSPSHTVRAGWLAEARETGMTSDLRARVRGLLAEAVEAADGVLCTCSTLGPVVDDMAASHPNVARIDRPMMERAAGHDGTLLVAYCLGSTLDPTLELLRGVLRERARDNSVVPVSCAAAWQFFESGDRDEFAETIARQVTAAVGAEAGTGCVVLAQAQAAMAAAEPLLVDHGVAVYSSPRPAVEAVLAAANDRPSSRRE